MLFANAGKFKQNFFSGAVRVPWVSFLWRHLICHIFGNFYLVLSAHLNRFFYFSSNNEQVYRLVVLAVLHKKRGTFRQRFWGYFRSPFFTALCCQVVCYIAKLVEQSRTKAQVESLRKAPGVLVQLHRLLHGAFRFKIFCTADHYLRVAHKR